MWASGSRESQEQCVEPESGPHDLRTLKLEQVSVGALTGISLSIAPGEIVCLSGASGSGKSRLLRAIADLDVHGGEVWLGETAQSAVTAHRWRGWVMLVPSESAWWAERVEEHFAEHRELDRELTDLGLEPGVLDWQVGRLSSGEKQRLALLRACSHDPRALLLDEPTANLDPELTLHAEGWLVRWARGHRLPVLWVSHDKSQIGRVADRHCHIQGSRLEHR